MAGNIQALHIYLYTHRLQDVITTGPYLFLCGCISNKLGWEGLGSRSEPGYVSISLLSNTFFCISTIASVQKFAIGSSTSVSFMKIPKGGTKGDQKTFWGKGDTCILSSIPNSKS